MNVRQEMLSLDKPCDLKKVQDDATADSAVTVYRENSLRRQIQR